VRRRLLLSALALFAASFGTASAALPVRHAAVVLSVLPDRHVLRLVEGPRVIDASYRGAVAGGLSAGSRITFAMSGAHAVHIVPSGRVDHVNVYGFVVREGKTLELRLADASLLAAPRSTRLKIGALVHVVVRFTSSGTNVVAPSNTSPASPPGSPHKPAAPGTSHCALADCSFDVTGVVATIDNSGALTIDPLSGGAALTVDPGAIGTTGVSVGDFVHVVGTQSATTGAYTITSLVDLPGCDNANCSLTLDAYVDEVDATSVIVEDDAGDEYEISATAQELSGLQVGDAVHIVGTQDPTTGDYTATQITVTATN
jgi:hypothetical protein